MRRLPVSAILAPRHSACADAQPAGNADVDRQFDYAQKILLAVEFADAPRTDGGNARPPTRCSSGCRSRRSSGPSKRRRACPLAAERRRQVSDRARSAHGLLGGRVPDGKQCFVHYAIGTRRRHHGRLRSAQGTAAAWCCWASITSSRNRRPILTVSRPAPRPIIGASDNISR